ncbi:hypothetical protein BHE74_00019822 [Ensete ventricosum]|nr:hypothetical protein BHE74_00019822 [Ensete ventricosum]
MGNRVLAFHLSRLGWLFPYRSPEVMGARGYHRVLGFVIRRPRNRPAVGKNLLMPASPSLLSIAHAEEAIAFACGEVGRWRFWFAGVEAVVVL